MALMYADESLRLGNPSVKSVVNASVIRVTRLFRPCKSDSENLEAKFFLVFAFPVLN